VKSPLREKRTFGLKTFHCMDNRPLKKVLERDVYTIADRSISLGGEQRMKVLVPEERFESSRSSHSVAPESVEA
jgi:hypothetical protein